MKQSGRRIGQLWQVHNDETDDFDLFDECLYLILNLSDRGWITVQCDGRTLFWDYLDCQNDELVMDVTT